MHPLFTLTISPASQSFSAPDSFLTMSMASLVTLAREQGSTNIERQKAPTFNLIYTFLNQKFLDILLTTLFFFYPTLLSLISLAYEMSKIFFSIFCFFHKWVLYLFILCTLNLDYEMLKTIHLTSCLFHRWFCMFSQSLIKYYSH